MKLLAPREDLFVICPLYNPCNNMYHSHYSDCDIANVLKANVFGIGIFH